MQRIDPVLPDLLPLGHRLGPPPVPTGDDPVLDPVDVRLVWPGQEPRAVPTEHPMQRRACRFLVHAAAARARRDDVVRLLGAGFGALVVLDAPLLHGELPAPAFAGQIVVLAPWFPGFWGRAEIADMAPWAAAGVAGGVLVGLGPAPAAEEELAALVATARERGAAFVVPAPLGIPAEERHRAYDLRTGSFGDGALEDLLFHSDQSQLAMDMERELSRLVPVAGLTEGLPGPSCAHLPLPTATAAGRLLLWARRLDLLDGVASTGWQLRRAAQALTASRRDPETLLAEDNLRIIPGFAPWVEAFFRSMWRGEGAPFSEILARWLQV